MPIYEFACDNCRTLLSFFSRRVNATATPSCPKCGKPVRKQVSLFTAGRSGSDADPLGIGDDCLDEDFPDTPDFDPGDERIAGAIAAMGDRLDRIDPSNTVEAAKTLNEFAARSGVKFGKDIMGALGRIAAGDDSEASQRQLADAIEKGHLLDDVRKMAKRGLDPETYVRDPTLYDM